MWQAVGVFPFRERNDGVYNVPTYLCAKMIEELSLAFLCSIAFGESLPLVSHCGRAACGAGCSGYYTCLEFRARWQPHECAQIEMRAQVPSATVYPQSTNTICCPPALV